MLTLVFAWFLALNSALAKNSLPAASAPTDAGSGGAGSCDSIADQEAKFCKKALQAGSNSPGGNAGDSVASAAAQQLSASSSQRNYLQDAIDYCVNRRKKCSVFCSPSLENAAAQGSVQTQCEQILARGRLPSSIQCLASPLVLRMGDAPLELTSPWQGIVFDILGRIAAPAHALLPISWFSAKSADDTYFIVLPDEKNQVGGIDQMFGNNTLGPDQKYALNGFEALAKYDGRRDDGSIINEFRDGVINAKDPFFARLRLWHDLNGNGIAEAGELLTLTEMGIASIDLTPTSFIETDTYGNTLNMRSVASLSDGSYRLVFDLWFTLP